MPNTKKMYYVKSTKGFYDFPINKPHVEITMEMYKFLMAKVKLGYLLRTDVNGHPYVVKANSSESTSSCSELFSHKLYALNEEYEQICRMVRGTYPETETATWTMQLSEAQAFKKWRKDGGDPVQRPEFVLLDPLSNERDLRNVGAGLEDLVNRIVLNAQIYNLAIAKATAIRHSAEQTMERLVFSDDLVGIDEFRWDFGPVITFLRSLGIV